MAGVRSLFRVVLGFLWILESRGQTGCPDGYVYHQPNRLCYKAFNDTATYNGAVSRCSSDGGVLAIPRDNATNNFLIDLKNAVDINAFFRFGLTDVHQEGLWIWDDNVPLGDFRAWFPGEPNNAGNEDCAEYFSESHSYSNTWNDGPCSRDDRKFICQVSLSGQCWDPGVPANGIRDNNSNFTSGQTVRYTCMDGYWLLLGTANITCQPDGTWSGVPPTCGGCPDGYVYHQPNRLCYKAFNDTATYNGAVSRCSSDGGVLAIPRDNATNNFLIDLKNAVDINAWFRFGLTDVNQEGVWMWDDNVPLGDFRAWFPGEPNNSGNEDCAEYCSGSHSYKPNTWNDGSCTRDDKFICQVSLSGQCWDPGVPANGIRDNNSNFISGQTVRYTCMDGFQLFGTANINCQPDGTWSGVPPTCGCPTVVLYGGSDTEQAGRMTSYTMTGDTLGDRPVYYSSVNCNYLYYYKPTLEWRVGPQFDRSGVRVGDSALYADQINGTFRLYIRNEWIENPDVKIACSDDVPAGVVVPQSVGSATNCTRVRLHGNADYQPSLMTTYTRTGQTSGGRPVYVSDTDSRDFLHFVESDEVWWVGPTIGQTRGFASVHNCAITPDQIRSPWILLDGNQWQVVWSVTASCIACPELPLPPNGNRTGGHLYGDTVTFSCNEGYELGWYSVIFQGPLTPWIIRYYCGR
ncbi:PREDICTED: CUB and sushi domain-containing protein 2-like [Branchiostoma belcheri]|uniref:CUB and sushi domain-containing protein 2-like n=1 Tax=Branchiostoma belcheri TaxID=7741 RepID=A0A6P5A096_BRABE|nr:PREDICTED: CUB and sushi domain-containing protein 2-like [Branchiostoma belcheri]